MSPRRCFAPALLLLCLTAAGCNSRRAKVSGRVTYDGQPLPSATVLFFTEDGAIEHALVQRDGTYRMASLPAGPMRVAVVSHPSTLLSWTDEAATSAAARTQRVPPRRTDEAVVEIPARYGKPEQSGLHYLVRKGTQSIDLDLVP